MATLRDVLALCALSWLAAVAIGVTWGAVADGGLFDRVPLVAQLGGAVMLVLGGTGMFRRPLDRARLAERADRGRGDTGAGGRGLVTTPVAALLVGVTLLIGGALLDL